MHVFSGLETKCPITVLSFSFKWSELPDKILSEALYLKVSGICPGFFSRPVSVNLKKEKVNQINSETNTIITDVKFWSLLPEDLKISIRNPLIDVLMEHFPTVMAIDSGRCYSS